MRRFLGLLLAGAIAPAGAGAIAIAAPAALAGAERADCASLGAKSARSATCALTPVPDNPFDGPTGAVAMHGDSLASDTTPLPGPGVGPVRVRQLALGGPCPTVLIGSDGYPVTLCTQVIDRTPVAMLLDPARGSRLAALRIAGGGNLFAGVYPYLDADDRLVVVDGRGRLLRIAHERAPNGRWSLRVASSVDLAPTLRAACGSATCGGIVGLSPDWGGRAWFATQDGVVGFAEASLRGSVGAGSAASPPVGGAVAAADADRSPVRVLSLPADERVANSIATAPTGTAVTTDHATYLLDARGPGGGPRIRWRETYDRGTTRKPGQLSQGSGSTPTFLGSRPTTADAVSGAAATADGGVDDGSTTASVAPADAGADAVAFLDNAEPAEHLIVRAASDGHLLCELPVLTPGPSGSENSPIGVDGAVIVASTYGYPYPAVPDWAGPSRPSAARLGAGVQRVDLDTPAPAASAERTFGAPIGASNVRSPGCHVSWTAPVRSAAVPKLSLADHLVYTVDRQPLTPGGHGGPFDPYTLVAIDATTGRVRSRQLIGATSLQDTMQLAGNIGPNGVLWQGNFSGLMRISSPAAAPASPTAG